MTRIFDIDKFSRNLRMIRHEMRITGRELERISGVSNAFLNQVENHQRIPNINIILWLCDWMGTPLDDYIKQK